MIDWDALVLAPTMQVFGEDQPPLYTPAGEAPFFLPGAVFDESYHHVEMQADGSQVTTVRPILGVRTILFPAPPAQNDTVMITRTGQRYMVSDVHFDGHGFAKLFLMEAA